MIFKVNSLKASFLFSALWHLFWISVICIAIVPTVKLQKQHVNINFLGPILEKTALDMLTEESAPHSETLYSMSLLDQVKAPLEAEGPKRVTKKNVFSTKKLEDMTIKDSSLISARVAKVISFVKRESIFSAFKERAAERNLEGPAKDRKILYKPPFPVLSKVSYSSEVHFVAKLKFTLSNDGDVRMVEPVTSSGFAEIDRECIKYLKLWKFSPALPLTSGEDWGLVTLKVKAE